MGVAELRRLRQLEEENQKLKQLVADLSLDKKMLQDVLAKKRLTPARQREVVGGPDGRATGSSERRACAALAFPRSSQRYEATPRPAGRPAGPAPRPGRGPGAVRLPAAPRPAPARGLGGQPQAGLSPLHPGAADHAAEGAAAPRQLVSRGTTGRPSRRPNQAWAMDFMSDALADGRKIRVLTVLDLFTRECLAIRVDSRFTGGAGGPRSWRAWPPSGARRERAGRTTARSSPGGCSTCGPTSTA